MLTPEQKKIETKRQQNYPLIMILSKQKCCDRRSFYLATIYGSFVHLFWYTSGSLMN